MAHPKDSRAEVWQLHTEERLSVRQIADRLGMSPSSVQRALQAGRDLYQDAVRTQTNEAEQRREATSGAVIDMAEWLRVKALEDYEDSLRVQGDNEEHPSEKYGVDYRSIALERKERRGVRAELARLLGIDPIRREALELRRQQLDGGQGVDEKLKAFFGDAPAITPPPTDAA
ncbi:MAG: helix-turn-helix domain-containing protein [Anaerolineae bacterium]